MTSVLVVDNYDSFTYNLVQYLGELGAELEVVRNDAAGELLERAPRPGDRLARARARRTRRASRWRRSGAYRRGRHAGARRLPRPPGAGRRRSAARVVRGEPVHGKTAEVEHDGRTIFDGLESRSWSGRYHSLVVDPDLPDALEVSATVGRRDHGPPPPRAARRGRAVPPGVGAHAARASAAAQLPRWPNERASPGAIDRGGGAARGPRPPRRGRRGAARDRWRATRPRSQTAAFLIALRTKGETVDEIAGLAAHDARAARCRVDARRRPASTRRARAAAGPTFNVSTTAAFVAAGAGCRGGQARQPLGHRASAARPTCSRRSARSIDLEPDAIADCIEEIGFGFMFAPLHHPAMQARRAGPQGARRCARSSTSSAR